MHRQPLISSEDREMQLSKKAPVVKLHGGWRRGCDNISLRGEQCELGIPGGLTGDNIGFIGTAMD